MEKNKRWQKAQEYEQRFWGGVAKRIAWGVVPQLDWLAWLEWKASEVDKRLAPYLLDEEKKCAKILEIGNGPIGVISFLKWGERYAIDPLEEFYKSEPLFTQLRDPAVNYLAGKGEELPFEDDFFSLVINYNVLDHVSCPAKFLSEIHRVLSKKGLLYLAVNVYTRWGAFVRSILSQLLIDKGHPYTFTIMDIRNFLRKHQFSILSESIYDYNKDRYRAKNPTSWKDKIKNITGISEVVYYAICSKMRDNA